MTEVITETISITQVNCLKGFGGKVNALGNDFAVFDPDGHCIVECYVEHEAIETIKAEECVKSVCQESSREVHRFGSGDILLARCLREDSDIVGVAVIRCECQPEEGVIVDYPCCSEVNDVNGGGSRVDCMAELLDMFAVQFEHASKSSKQIEKVGSELAQTYEELVLLYNIKHLGMLLNFCREKVELAESGI